MPKAVEQHRELHRRKVDGLELFPQRISGGVHQQRMERTADVQRQAAPRPSGKRQVGSFVYSSFLAADNQLAGTVVIADLYNALFGGCAATCLQGCFIQSQNGCHPTGAPGSGSSHRFATESR